MRERLQQDYLRRFAGCQLPFTWVLKEDLRDGLRRIWGI